jgi:hypothetical protein
MGRLLQAMKHEHHSQYKPEDTERAEAALLTVWAVLQDFRDELVLVGGLVPRYICRPAREELQPVTMDVDVGVALGLSSGIYDTTTTRLGGAGFEWKEKRFQKQVGKTVLYLDLLTDRPEKDSPETAMVDDVPVSAVYGVQRALENFREVDITGRDLYTARVTQRVKICEVGPFACLKLQAYGSRHQSKDVFDFVRAVRDYDCGGPEEAVRLFHAECGRNLAYDVAMQVLTDHFDGPESKGPAQYADFCVGGIQPETSDGRFIQSQRINEALDVAGLLLKRQP